LSLSFSIVSCKELGEAAAAVGAPRLSASLRCTSCTPLHIFCCGSATPRGDCAAGAWAASFMAREGRAVVELAKLSAFSLPRFCQRPCSTQNEAIGTGPDFRPSTISTLSTRSCLPPLTISPAWMNTSLSPVFSISSELTLLVSRTRNTPFCIASCKVIGTLLPAVLSPRTGNMVRFSYVTG
jgi:hypothetical protein